MLTKTCIHHMVIEAPHGTAMVQGTCRKCGLVRDYRASGELIEFGEFTINGNRNKRRSKRNG